MIAKLADRTRAAAAQHPPALVHPFMWGYPHWVRAKYANRFFFAVVVPSAPIQQFWLTLTCGAAVQFYTFRSGLCQIFELIVGVVVASLVHRRSDHVSGPLERSAGMMGSC